MPLIVAGAIFLLTFLTPHTASFAQQIPPAKQSPTPLTYVYKVGAGDSLFSIAKKEYGGEKYWTSIWNDNDWITNPAFIKKDWSLKMRNKKLSKSEKLTPKLDKIYADLTAPQPASEPDSSASAIADTGTPTSFDDVYKAAGAKYNVPWQILYGLHLTETGLRDGPIASGYGTGAQGPMQFMPGTWSAYGVDGNGDGVADINNAVDAIYGAANYLAAHGGGEAGLKYYGGSTQSVLSAATSRGYNP